MGFRIPFFHRDSRSPEARFWSWFQDHEQMFLNFRTDQERTFDKLQAAIKKVHPGLTFEFGLLDDEWCEFVISADGSKKVFPFVEALHAAAPDLPRWTITKFRPRRPPLSLSINDRVLKPEDVEVAVLILDGKAELTMFVRGCSDPKDNQMLQLLFIMLDHVIGEYDMVTRVGPIDVRPFDFTSNQRRFRLEDLPQVFDNSFL